MASVDSEQVRPGTSTERAIVSQTPTLLFVLTVASIFAAETAVMVVLPPWPSWLLTLVDSALLVVLLFPLLYLFTFRPMRLQLTELIRLQAQLKHEIVERREAESALRRSENQLRELSSQVLRGHEKEKRHVAHELHEELGQSLTILKLMMSLVKESLAEDKREALQECEHGIAVIDSMIGRIRQLSRDLSPAVLEEVGLSIVLRRLVTNWAKGASQECSVQMIDIDQKVPKKDWILVYRILQEALSNIELHSKSTLQSIVISEADGILSMAIEDNGQGFDPAQVRTSRNSSHGIGLAVMEERARMLGGSLRVWSQPGKGSRITLAIPLPAQKTWTPT